MQTALNLLLSRPHTGQTLHEKVVEGTFLLEDGRQEAGVECSNRHEIS